jgi:hypothetical protein
MRVFLSSLCMNNIHVPHFVYPIMYWWNLDCLYFLAIVNNAAVSMRGQISLRDPDFYPFGWIPKIGIAGLYILICW